jgi:putative tricarboxylic transport membrane protein
VAFYVDLMKKVRETQDWKDFIKLGAFNDSFMTGGDFVKWVEKNETLHKSLMQEAGFLAK